MRLGATRADGAEKRIRTNEEPSAIANAIEARTNRLCKARPDPL